MEEATFEITGKFVKTGKFIKNVSTSDSMGRRVRWGEESAYLFRAAAHTTFRVPAFFEAFCAGSAG